jgi:murein L,D-transpeptidase YcbB/YkuD
MKKLVLSAAILAVLTGGMTTAVSIATMVPASACAATSAGSEDVARKLPRGTYAGETPRAVRDFQCRHHIRASGVVGSKTWQALVGRKPKTRTGGHMHVVVAFSLRPGERNQGKFNVLHNMVWRIYPCLDRLNGYSGPTDAYGPEMQKMVRDFQKRAGTKASGIVGPQTVAAMNEAISVAGQWGC